MSGYDGTSFQYSKCTILQVTELIESFQILSSEQNPFMWDPSASRIKSSVLTLNLYGEGNKEIVVKDLDEDIEIEIQVPEGAIPKVRHSIVTSADTSLKEFVVPVPNMDSSVHIILRPMDEEKLEIYIRYNESPTVTEHDINITVPKIDVDATGISTQDMVDEFAHTIFLPPEYIQEHGTGDYIIGVRIYGNSIIINFV